MTFGVGDERATVRSSSSSARQNVPDKILLRKKQTAKRETKLPSASGNRIQQRRYYSGGTDGYGCSLPFIVVVVVAAAVGWLALVFCWKRCLLQH